MRLNGCSGKLCPMQVGTVDNCALTKEECPYFTQDIDVLKILNQIKTEVAKEIFEEIEGCIFEYGSNHIFSHDKFDELKKKYTEDNK